MIDEINKKLILIKEHEQFQAYFLKNKVELQKDFNFTMLVDHFHHKASVIFDCNITLLLIY